MLTLTEVKFEKRLSMKGADHMNKKAGKVQNKS